VVAARARLAAQVAVGAAVEVAAVEEAAVEVAVAAMEGLGTMGETAAVKGGSRALGQHRCLARRCMARRRRQRCRRQKATRCSRIGRQP